MKQSEPQKLWWTADEIADGALPEMPTTRRRVNSFFDRLDLRADPALARRRHGRGGGWEYNWKGFPLAARKLLLTKADVAELEAEAGPDRLQVWAQFESLAKPAKAKAKERLRIVLLVADLERSGLSRFLAVEQVCSFEQPSPRTIWNWLALISAARPDDWLAYLAPRHKVVARKVNKATCDKDFMDYLKGDYLRLSGPAFAASYRRAIRVANQRGYKTLTERTALRRLNAEVPRVTQVLRREGWAGLERCFPPQIRDKSSLVAMECVNADCHKLDLFVRWADGTVNRPQLVAFQDIYSGKILSWKVDHTPNKVAVMSAFGEMIEEHGIPTGCVFDNGREFANKWLTGGTATRFRFTVRDDDPLGVLPNLGIKIHWATPGHGQAKPIERTFRDIAEDVAKDPRFEGAYCGNRPDAKPENWKSRIVEFDEFLAVLDEGIREHNARKGRLSPTAKGRSFDDTFAESYATAPIRKSTDEQRRLWLMGQEVRKLHKTHGTITLLKSEYWSAWMNEFAGQKVIARFDPYDLHAGLQIYGLNGEYLGFAACREASEFLSLDDARDHARNKAKIRKAEKMISELSAPMRARDVAKVLADVSGKTQKTPTQLEAKVVKMVQPKQPISRPVPDVEPTPQERVAHEAKVAQFRARRKPPVAEPEVETRQARFARALKIEAASEAGTMVSRADAEFYASYRETAEFRTDKRIADAKKRQEGQQ